MMFYLLLFSVSWGGLFSLTIRGEKLHSPYASVITRAKDAWVMGEFVVIGCSDDCYDVESDIWEEMACGTGKGEGGADNVLFFFQCDGLKGCCNGFLVSGLHFDYDKGIVTVVICYDVDILVSIVPIAGEDGIALLTEIFLCLVFTPFSKVIVSCHDFCILIVFS